MTVNTRTRQRQRPLPTLDNSVNENYDASYDDALQALLERLETIRSEAVAMRDEHTRAAVQIEEHITTREVASKVVTKVKSLRAAAEPMDYSNALLASRASKPLIPPTPSLPAVKLLAEQEPSEKLILEQSIIIRAQAITRKNAELARERLPKQPEAQRNRTWLDYFVDEAVWMATDFREERKWKIQVAKKLSRSVMQYHAQRATREARLKLEEHQRMVKAANSVARDVRKFWSQIRELAEFRLSRAEKARMLEESQEKLSKFLERTQAYSDQLVSRFQSSALQPDTVVNDEVKRAKLSGFISSEKQTFQGGLPGDIESTNCYKNSDPFSPQSPELGPRVISSENIAPSISVQNTLQNGNQDSNNPHSRSVIRSPKIQNASSMLAALGLHSQHSRSSVGGGLFDETKLPGVRQMSSGNCSSKNIVCQPSPDSQERITGASHDKLCQNPRASEGLRRDVVRDAPRTSFKPADSPAVNGPDDTPRLDQRGSQWVSDIEKGEEDKCDMESPHSSPVSIQEPKLLLRGKLRDYQYSGMQWLVNLYKNASNGILADEMGLGKTIQTIALLAWLAIEEGVWGPHLIVVPTSVMLNWEVEFKKWLPSLKILTYFGSIKERRQKRKGWTDPELFHVCITSYTLAVQDNHILRRKKWIYLILDEAHNIKNFKSQRWQTLLNFSAQRRLLLTGTPLQNSVMDLWSLLHFLMPSLFESHSEFKDWFSSPLQNTDDSLTEDISKRVGVVEKLHSALRPFLLRRLKADVEKGLPPKHEHIIKCHLGKRQRQLYEDFMARSDVKENLNSGDVFKVMNVLMQLRKVCNHPDLFEGRPILSPFAMKPIFYPVPRCITDLCRRRPLDKINLDLLSLDLCSAERSWPGYWFNRESERLSAERLLRDLAVDQVLSDQHQALEHMNISEAARQTLVRSATFHQEALYHAAIVSAHRIRARGLLGEDVRAVCSMTPSSLMQSLRLNRSTHDSMLPHCTPCLVNSVEDMSESWREACEQFVFCVTKVSSPSVELRYQGDDAEYANSSDLSLQLAHASSPLRTLLRQFDVRRQVTIPDKRLVQWDCGKLQILDVLLRRLMAQSSRVLIFTQMSKVLDVLESFLNLHTYRYLRLDGTTRTDDRQKLVQRFNTDKRIFCMILTTRAGGVGLNLTGADSVVFYDTDYNPAIDNQAQDRAHRIGQTKPVHIYRLICEQTVEENILQRANRKRSLESQIISEAGFTVDGLHRHEIDDQRAQIGAETSVRPRTRVADLVRQDRSMILNNVSNTVSSSSNGSALGDDNIRNRGLGEVTGAHGNFEGFKTAKSLRVEGHSDVFGRCNAVTSNGSGEYENLVDDVMSWEDDQEEEIHLIAERERRLLDAEFEDEHEDTTGVRRKCDPVNDEPDLESSLNPVQKYALRIIEAWSSGEDNRGNLSSTSPEASSCIERLVQGSESFTEVKKKDRMEDGSAIGSAKTDMQDEPTDLRSELFYELDVSEEGKLNYLKALTDADVDLNLYLPLRDGGPEELKVSAVVCGTAAAGLECAEDAAFFPHAYNRMSRTPYATKRQKEKSRANLLKIVAGRRPREGENQLHASLPNDGNMMAINSPTWQNGTVPLTVSVIARGIADTPAVSPNIGEGEHAIIAKMNQNASSLVVGGCASTSSATNSYRLGNDVLSESAGKRKAVNSAGLVKCKNRIPDLARTILEFSMKSNRNELRKKPRGYSKLESTTIINDTYPNTGLFRKAPKKATKKPTQLTMRSVRGTGGGSLIDGSKSDNSGWTKEEDEELMKLAELYNNNMQLVADILSNSEKVLIGTRRRRSRDRCSERFLKCLGKGRISQPGPLEVTTDTELMQRHKDGVKGVVEKKAPDLAALYTPTVLNEIHPTQAVIVAEAQAKTPGFISSMRIPTLGAVEKFIVVPAHHRPGWKPTETTPSALQRKKYPYMGSAREDLRLDNNGTPLKTSNYGSGYQVSGCAPGDTIVVSAPPSFAEGAKRAMSSGTGSGSIMKNMAASLVNNVKCLPASGLPGNSSCEANNVPQLGNRATVKSKTTLKTPLTKPVNSSVFKQNASLPQSSRRDPTSIASSGIVNDLKSRANGTQVARTAISNSKVVSAASSVKKITKRPLITENLDENETNTKSEGQIGVSVPKTNDRDIISTEIGRSRTDMLSGIKGPIGVVKQSGRGKATGTVRRLVGNISGRGLLQKNRGASVTPVGKTVAILTGGAVHGSSSQGIGRGGSNQNTVRNGVLSSSMNMVEKSSVAGTTMGFVEGLSCGKNSAVDRIEGSNRTDPQMTNAKISVEVDSIAKDNGKYVDNTKISVNGNSRAIDVGVDNNTITQAALGDDNKLFGNSSLNGTPNQPIEVNGQNGVVKENNGELASSPKVEGEKVDGKEMQGQVSTSENMESKVR